MTLLAAVGLGLLIGLVIGALGGGGSILTVPVLVYLLGLRPHEAITASLVIVGVTAGVASIGHARSGHTRWRSGLLIALSGVPASVLGARLNARVDPDALLLAFAGLMLAAAAAMLIRAGEDGQGGVVATPGVGSGGAITRTRPDVVTTRGQAVRVLVAGLGIGALTGFFGVGGGFVIVPVLVVALSFPIAAAVGTSLLVIALNSAVALGARAGQGSFDWHVIVPFTAAAVLAALLGERVAHRLPAPALTRVFIALLVLVAGYVAVRSGLALREGP